MLKAQLRKFKIAHILRAEYSAIREYRYDRKTFLNNYAHSQVTKDKIGYRLLYLSHSLEKGMCSTNPRIYGGQKIGEIGKLLEKYSKICDGRDDFAVLCTVNILRSYLEFFEKNNWINTMEYRLAQEIVKRYSYMPQIEAGSQVLTREKANKGRQFDYRAFLNSRHSVRQYEPVRISEKEMRKAVETAILSPSACNRQMCKVYFANSTDAKNAVVKYGQGLSCFDKESINAIVITFDINSAMHVGERNQGWFNAGLFSMNLVNALHSQGIGSCFCQFGNSTKQEEQLKKLLDIPASERIAVILSAGYYCDKSIIPYSPRKKIEDIYRKR